MDVDMDMDMDMGSQDRFVARLLERYGVGGGPHGQPKVNFAELANDLEAKGVFRTVPSTTFLLDSNWAPAAPREKKKQREKRQRTTDEQLYTAKSVDINELQETDEANAQVTRIEKLLETVTERAGPEGDVPINLFRLLLHPTSFPQTVENFFDLSFLVKDGRVAMQADAGGAYVVLSKPPLADAYHKGLLKTQNILKLDYATYRKLVARWCGEGAPYLASRY